MKLIKELESLGFKLVCLENGYYRLERGKEICLIKF